jgi:hypothetical protein
VLEVENFFIDWKIFQARNMLFLKNWNYPNPLDLLPRLEESPSNFHDGIFSFKCGLIALSRVFWSSCCPH